MVLNPTKMAENGIATKSTPHNHHTAVKNLVYHLCLCLDPGYEQYRFQRALSIEFESIQNRNARTGEFSRSHHTACLLL